MGGLRENNLIESETPMEFGDSEAAKLAAVVHDHKQSIEYSLQQSVRPEKVSRRKSESRDKNHVRLGPCFKPEKVKEVVDSLTECFPAKFTKPPYLNEPEKLVCHWVRSSNKPTNGWTCSINTRPWFDRLSSRHGSWKKLRIYEFLKLSTYPRFPFYDALTAGLVCCWNPCLNVFVTGQGFRTITIEDVAFITGLSPAGIDLPTQSLIDGAIDMEKIPPWENKANLPFSPVADKYNLATNKITREEEVLFINFALCKMMMFPSCNVNKTFLKLAANIEACGSDTSKIKPVCLAPIFLGQVYRCLYRLRTHEKLYTAGGPVWILSLWGVFYFPFLAKERDQGGLDYEELDFDKPPAVPVNECCCYGEVAIHAVSPVVHLSFEEVLRGLLLPCELSQSDWHPFSRNGESGIPIYLPDVKGSLIEDTSGEWMKKAAPLWLLDLSSMNFREGDEPHWLSVLQPRDLMCIEPKAIGVEAYNPNLVARQFGMTQGLGIPFYKTLNRPWGSRLNIPDIAPKSGDKFDNKNTSAEAWLKSDASRGVSSCEIIQWFRWAAVDSGYELWWADFLKRCETSWPDAIVTLIQHVQGPTPIDSTLTAKASSFQSRRSTGNESTPLSTARKALSQVENSVQTTHGTRGQKRKTETSPTEELSQVESVAQKTFGTRGQKRKTAKTTSDITSSKKPTIEGAEEPDTAIVTGIQHVQRLPRVVRTLSTAHVASSQNSKSTGAPRIVAGLSQALSQMNFAQIPPAPSIQIRTTTSLSSEQATNEEAVESDDDIPLTALRMRTIRPQHDVPTKSLSNGISQKDTDGEMNVTLQDLQADALNDRLNCQKKEAEIKGTTNHGNELDSSQAAPNFPENHENMTSEETVVEAETHEPEDSLEPPHEMVRGMGLSSLTGAKCLVSVGVVPSSSSSLPEDDSTLVKEGRIEQESDAHDAGTPNDFSRALVIDTSSQPLNSLHPSAREGVSYAPDKVLAEANSVVNLIHDPLHPVSVSVPSAFGAERGKAEEIVDILQNNVKDLTIYTNLADQISRLLEVSPPQFQLILSHYQTIFLSLRDQLTNIQEKEDSMTNLSKVAKDLKDCLETSQGRVDQLRAQCTQYDNEIDELEAKLICLKQLRETRLQELSVEEGKFAKFSSTWSETVPSLQKVNETVMSAHQAKAQWECTLKAINDNVQSFVGLLKTM